MKKKLLSLLLAMSVVMGGTPAASAADSVPFSARAGETELSVACSEEEYRYTEVTEYDENWNPVATEERTSPLYTVTVPEGADSVTLDFGADLRLAYGYDDAGNYVAAYGDYGDGSAGQTTATVSGELPDYVRVQSPYDESWNSTLLYAVSFQTADTQPEPDNPEPPAEQPAVSVEQLLETIAAGYTDNSGDWVVMDMAAYAALYPETAEKTTAQAKQAYLDGAIAGLQEDGVSDSSCAKAILALTAVGADAEKLHPADGSAFSAVEKLNGADKPVSAWSTPYVLAAYNQKEYAGTEETEEQLLAALLAAQGADGSWDEWGTIDTTANAIAGLAFYADRPEVSAAMEKGIAYLSGQMLPSGAFDGGYGENANSTAMVVIALAAAGVNPDTDSRFVTEEGVSALDGLLSFALSDATGFGYTDASALNALATEQCFRALIAAKGTMDTGAAYNIYDFSETPVAPAYATGADSGSGGGSHDRPQTPNQITVHFTLKSDSTLWLPRRAVSVADGATVCHVLTQVLDAEGYTYDDPADNYVAWIQHPNGDRLAEFDHGSNSGWMYTVNGAHPALGINEQLLKEGDRLVFHYTGDYTREPDGKDEPTAADRTAARKVKALIDAIGTVTADSGKAIRAARAAYDALTEAQRELLPNYQTLLDAEKAWETLAAPLPFADVSGHWALAAIDSVYRRGLMQGTSADAFSPEQSATRGMIAEILYRLEGQPAVRDAASFEDVAADSYCADATAWAAENGIMQGYTASSFGPGNAVTRQQMAAILYRYAAYSGRDVSARADLSRFSDASAVSGYAREAMEWAIAEGLFTGRSATVLSPGGETTRAQTAVLLTRFLAAGAGK